MRYQIWNGTDSIITPSGAQFTAQEWADRYTWVKLPGASIRRNGWIDSMKSCSPIW